MVLVAAVLLGLVTTHQEVEVVLVLLVQLLLLRVQLLVVTEVLGGLVLYPGRL
jgi:hypothetical protein